MQQEAARKLKDMPTPSKGGNWRSRVIAEIKVTNGFRGIAFHLLLIKSHIYPKLAQDFKRKCSNSRSSCIVSVINHNKLSFHVIRRVKPRPVPIFCIKHLCNYIYSINRLLKLSDNLSYKVDQNIFDSLCPERIYI